MRNVMPGEKGVTWEGKPVDVRRVFPVLENYHVATSTLMVAVVVHEENGDTHRRNVLVGDLHRRK